MCACVRVRVRVRVHVCVRVHVHVRVPVYVCVRHGHLASCCKGNNIIRMPADRGSKPLDFSDMQ